LAVGGWPVFHHRARERSAIKPALKTLWEEPRVLRGGAGPAPSPATLA